MRWVDDTLHIEGQAYIGLLDVPERGSSNIELTLRQEQPGRIVELPVDRVHRPDVTAAAGEGAYNYDWCGFRTAVRAETLRAPGSQVWEESSWRLGVNVSTAGVSRGRQLRATAPGRAQRPELLNIDGVRIIPTTGAGKFAVEVDTMQAVIDSMRLDGEVLQLEGSLRAAQPDPASARLVVRRSQSTSLTYPVALSPKADCLWDLISRVPLSDLVNAIDVADRASHIENQGNGVAWEVSLEPAGGQAPIRLSAGGGLAEGWHTVGDREIVVSWNRQGKLELVERGFRPMVTSALWSDDHQLELQGTYREPSGLEVDIVLKARERVEEHSFPMERTGDRFTAVLTPAAITTLAGTLPLAEGSWDLIAREVRTDEPLAQVAIDRKLLPSVPLTATVGAKDFCLRDVDYNSLSLDVGPDLLPNERGRHHEARLRKIEFPAFVRRGVRDAVLFESYGAKQYADSPRALYEELAGRDTGLELLWSVSDGQTELPDGLVPVRRGGTDWYEAAARSRYVVTCVYRSLGTWLTPPSDQVVVQTWHGAPFKKIGFDSERVERVAGRGYHDRLMRETARWNHLISPNPPSTPILRSAFRYEGNILETGYPRTDIFFRPDREDIAARVRSRIGVPEGKTVVLYAPTYRDDQHYRTNEFRLDLRLDLRRAAEALGDD
ncbi:MAG: CDP-glycerol glycerophosphotransferase family protein, partial [Actinomycetes bacterium]